MNKQPTIKEIAKQLKVAVSTVSRALSDHPSIGLRTKMRVLEVAKKMGYEPNMAAVKFKKGKASTLGVILPELSENFFSQAISGVEDTAASHDYTVLFGQSHDDEEREKTILSTFRKNRVDGLLVSISKNTRNIDHFLELINGGTPVVFFDRAPKNENISSVTCDLYNGTIDIVNYLWKRGHKNIALIKGPQQLQASNERMKGFMEGLNRKRMKTDPSLFATSDLTRDSTWKAMDEIFSQKSKPTAIVTFNDYVALDAIQYIKQSTSLKINEDISFVSYANLPLFSYLDSPPMASLEQFPYEQGRQAAELLLNLINSKGKDIKPQQIIIPGKLSVINELEK